MLRNLAPWLWLSVALFMPAPPLIGQTPPPIEAPADQQRRQLLEQLGVDRWHKLGYRGQGLKIAVLDTGFRGWHTHLGQGLPQQVTTRSFRADGDLEARDSQHGILCAEILHAIAPDAQLLFANWDTEAPASFLQAVRWAKQQGARVLTCSVIMPSWSDGEGGGNVHAALDLLVGKDLLFFASAGNVAQRHWTGTLRPDERGWHQWRDGAVANTLEPWGQERVAVEVYGPLDGLAILQLVDASSGELIRQTPLNRIVSERQVWQQAVARFDPKPGHNYQVGLKCVSKKGTGPVDLGVLSPFSTPADGAKADKDAKFHLVVLGGNLEHSHAAGSIAFPADGARVLAVGAVDRRGQRAVYSSCGPNSRLPKPDFVATVPFPSQCRERPFSGTSAAAPQAAALAAVWWSRQPAWTAAQIQAALHAAAFDLGPKGHDCETGYGLVRLP